MSILDLPEQIAQASQAQYAAARTKANSFMNRNWWWVCLACLGVGIVIGLWNPLGIGK